LPGNFLVPNLYYETLSTEVGFSNDDNDLATSTINFRVILQQDVDDDVVELHVPMFTDFGDPSLNINTDLFVTAAWSSLGAAFRTIPVARVFEDGGPVCFRIGHQPPLVGPHRILRSDSGFDSIDPSSAITHPIGSALQHEWPMKFKPCLVCDSNGFFSDVNDSDTCDECRLTATPLSGLSLSLSELAFFSETGNQSELDIE